MRSARRRLLALCILLLCVSPAQAQRLVTGTVRDASNGEPLPSATLFLQAGGLGTIANAVGYFEIQVPVMPAVLEVRHIGYETRRIPIDAATPAALEIDLEPVAYLLGELAVTDEDPAYNIMRKVIARKAEQRARMNSYSAEAYTRFMLYSENRLVQMEEQIASHFWRRGDVRQLVLARRSKPAASSTFRFASVQYVPNFYDDTIEIAGFRLVGPTHPDALEVYTFTLGGYRMQDGKTVYDIYMAPKNRLQTAFVGYVAVLDEDYAILEAVLRPDPELVLPEPIKTWDALYEQHFAPFMDSVWLPLDFQARGRVTFGRAGVQYPAASFTQVSRLSFHAVNAPVPDSLFARSERLAVLPYADRQDHLFRWNPGLVPMTPKELEEVVALDPRMTLGRAFRPMGLLAQYAALPVVEEPPAAEQEDETLGSMLLGRFYEGVELGYNRVDGFFLGLKREVRLAPRLRLAADAGYALTLKEPAYGAALTYRVGSTRKTILPGAGYLKAGFDRRRAPAVASQAYPSFFNALTTYVGWEDYADYYDRRAYFGEGGVTSHALRTTLYGRISREDHASVERTRDNKGWFFGDVQRDNPAIVEGAFTMGTLGLLVGAPAKPSLVPSATGVRVEIAHPLEAPAEVDFTRYSLTANLAIKTLYPRRRWPNTLHVRMLAQTIRGDALSQFAGMLETAQRPFAGFGAFKTLDGLPVSARSVAGVYWEHDFSTAVFEWLGAWGLVRLGIGLSVHGAYGKLWGDRFGAEPYRLADPGYLAGVQREAGVSLTHLFNYPIRIDLTRSGTTGRFAFGVGFVKRY
ncbi:MAG: DUF5686 family protein [Rhodothermales bacterium]